MLYTQMEKNDPYIYNQNINKINLKNQRYVDSNSNFNEERVHCACVIELIILFMISSNTSLKF
jgi:hypothetical protein